MRGSQEQKRHFYFRNGRFRPKIILTLSTNEYVNEWRRESIVSCGNMS